LNLWAELARLEHEGTTVVLVTVIRTQGSTPREVGARMIVLPDGSIKGTVGGSAVEALVIKDAQGVLVEGVPRIVHHTLNDAEKSDTGMICGGTMEFLLEPMGRQPHLYIFGAGHVGMALARIAGELNYPHWVLDDRSEFITPERFPAAVDRWAGPFPELTAGLMLSQPAYLIIVTRCHDTDLEVLRGILGKSYTYLGMICSRRKKAEIFRILQSEGFAKEELERVHAPIGLDIGSDSPAEIAISILAQVMQIFKKGSEIR
jgi:xanthine dehydrogenase accessory factor